MINAEDETIEEGEILFSHQEITNKISEENNPNISNIIVLAEGNSDGEPVPINISNPIGNSSESSFKSEFNSFLEKDTDAKLVVTHYKVHKCLNKETRGILTRTIIRRFKDDALKNVPAGEKLSQFSIPDNVLMRISKAIEEIFPGEYASTYFSPFKSENKIKHQKCGTLWAHFNYAKESMRKAGFLERSKKSEDEIPNAGDLVLEDEENISKALNELNNSLNTENLQDNWKITYNKRKSCLAVDQISVDDYIKLFPCLQTQDAIPLFQLDFDILQPNKSALLRERWSVIKTVVIQQLEIEATKILKKKKCTNLDDLVLIKLLPSLKSDSQDAIILHLLQLLVGCTRKSGKRKKGEKVEDKIIYQPAEIRECCIYRVEKTEDIESEIQDFKNRLFNRKETLQPTIVVTGAFSDIKESFVVINSYKYKTSSCLEALDLNFKIFFALDCQYPKASEKIWQLIQNIGYDIQLPQDSLVKTAKELLGLIRQKLIESSLLQEHPF